MKFKVGDRVAVYGISGNFHQIRRVATVDGFDECGNLYLVGEKLSHDGGPNPSRGHGGFDFSLAHPKQCRLLKPREIDRGTLGELQKKYGPQLEARAKEALDRTLAKRERMERWFRDRQISDFGVPTFHNRPSPGAIHLVELRQGEAVLDREKLAKAWNSRVASHITFREYDADGPVFRELCKAIGLPEAR